MSRSHYQVKNNKTCLMNFMSATNKMNVNCITEISCLWWDLNLWMRDLKSKALNTGPRNQFSDTGYQWMYLWQVCAHVTFVYLLCWYAAIWYYKLQIVLQIGFHTTTNVNKWYTKVITSSLTDQSFSSILKLCTSYFIAQICRIFCLSSVIKW